MYSLRKRGQLGLAGLLGEQSRITVLCKEEAAVASFCKHPMVSQWATLVFGPEGCLPSL